MTNTVLKEQITMDLTEFEKEESTELSAATSASMNLLRTLGYTEREKALVKVGGFLGERGFKARFIDEKEERDENFFFDEGKALVSDWVNIDVASQIKGETLGLDAYDEEGSEKKDKIIGRYTFFVIKLKKSEYTRSALAAATREINKGFGKPAFVIFSYGAGEKTKVTLSIIDRRVSKIDRAQDVLEKVSLIKDINVHSPHRSHVDILSEIAAPSLRATYEYTNLEGFHDALMKALDLRLLNNKFYAELSAWYFWALQNTCFPNGLKSGETMKAFYKGKTANEGEGTSKGNAPKGASESNLSAKGEGTSKDTNKNGALKGAVASSEGGANKNEGEGEEKPNEYTHETQSDHNANSLIRFVARILFVWFIKEHGFVDDAFFKESWAKRALKDFDGEGEESSYYRAVLQNLFFGALNCPIHDEYEDDQGKLHTIERHFVKNSERHNDLMGADNFMRNEALYNEGFAKNFLDSLNKKTPFMNGGLFECLDILGENKKKLKADGTPSNQKIYIDGFSNREDKSAIFPNKILFGEPRRVDLSEFYDKDDKARHTADAVTGLFGILNHYKFTVTENTPFEEDVALDPELLGRVFENLLASVNSETKLSARKSTGSFYTPREIVDYMVTQSLSEALKGTFGEKGEEVMKDLFCAKEGTDLSLAERQSLVKAIASLKVLDPACGSGAFPMGVLSRLVGLLAKVDGENKLWRAEQIEKATKKLNEEECASPKTSQEKTTLEKAWEEKKKAIKAQIDSIFDMSNAELDYTRKLYLIENCIYGVDIQPIAVQLTKLRCFITLASEQKADPTAPNFGIKPLPNLETRFIAANALLGLGESDKITLLGDMTKKADTIRAALDANRHKLFYEYIMEKKRKLRKEDERLRKELQGELKSIGFGDSAAQRIADWEPFNKEVSAPWFNAKWMYGVETEGEKGFDVVLGNPPYIQLQKATGAGGAKLGDLYCSANYKVFNRMGDIYCLFWEQATKLLRAKGVACFITSNKWMRAGYGEALRDFLSGKNPLKLIDFGGTKIFENATVDTDILLLANEPNAHSTKATTLQGLTSKDRENLPQCVEQKALLMDFCTKGSWVILNEIESAIKAKIEKAGTPLKDWNININYGIKTGFNDAFIIDEQTRASILADCKTKEEKARTDKLIRPILRGRDIKRFSYEWAGLYLIATFPAKSYDIERYPAVKKYLLTFGMERLEQTGKTHGDIKARKKTHNKWFETQDQIGYWQEFEKEKICWKAVGRNLAFSIVESGIFLTAPASFITAENKTKHILAFLCSTVSKYFIYNNSDTTGAGDIMLNIQSLEKFPIPLPADTSLVDRLVDKILADPGNEELEKELDCLVYKLYDLSAEEAAYIEQATKA